MSTIIMVTLLIAITFLIVVLFAILFLRSQVRNAKMNDFGVKAEVGSHDSDGVAVEKEK